jgi:hypothetical protein
MCLCLCVFLHRTPEVHLSFRLCSVELVVKAQRGVTFLYPLCDGKGSCAVIEASKSTPGSNSMNPLQYVNIPLLTPLLPTQEFLNTHPSAPFQNGVFVRTDDWVYPEGRRLRQPVSSLCLL